MPSFGLGLRNPWASRVHLDYRRPPGEVRALYSASVPERACFWFAIHYLDTLESWQGLTINGQAMPTDALPRRASAACRSERNRLLPHAASPP